jgi:hypothetical protein
VITLKQFMSGFSGLAVSMLVSGTEALGFDPGRNHRIFRANLSHVTDLQHVKEPCGLRGSQNHRPN